MKPKRQRRQDDQPGEEQTGTEEAESRDEGREVTDGGAEREGHGHRRPVEELACASS